MASKALLTLAVVSIFTLAGQALAGGQEDINKKILGSFAEKIFLKRDLSVVDQYMRADYIQHNPFVKQGSSGFKEFFSTWFDAVPDWQYTLKKIIAEDNEVWVYGTYAGTLKKDWLGIRATGQSYAVDAIDVFRIQDGKLAEHWDVMDIYGLFKQLGALK